MNRISDLAIENAVREKYKFITSEHSKDKILGVFTEGLVNYGFAERTSEIKFVAFYIPNFEELCFSPPREVFYPEENLTLKDFRNIYSIAEKENDNSIELLYGYMYINPSFENLFNECFINNREILSHYNDRIRIQKAKKRGIKALDNQDFFEAARLVFSAQLYKQGKPMEDCLCIKEEYFTKYLWDLKHGEHGDADLLYNELLKLPEGVKDEYNEAEEILKKGTLALFNVHFEEHVQTENFIEKLTKKELLAFEYIKEALGGYKGSVSISEILRNHDDVSRPVLSNVLSKMEKYKAAKVTNRGVKGTEIEILDLNLL